MYGGKHSKVVVTSVAVCILSGISDTGQCDTGAARDANRQVETLVASGEYEAAAETLAAVDCAGDRACRTLVDFGYGWLYESWPASESEQVEIYLSRSRAHYAKAHELSPDNVQVLANLALVSQKLGDISAAATAAEKIIALAPEEALQQYLFIGDLYASADATAKAIAAYRAAVELNPANRVAHQRLQETWRKAGAYRELNEHSKSIRYVLPELAATGCGYVVTQGYAQDPDLAEAALVRWAALRAELGTLSSRSLGVLPSYAEWQSEGLRELAGVLESGRPPIGDEALAWWLEGPERQDAMAKALRLKAARLRAEAETTTIEPAERQVLMQAAIDYLKAAVETAPPFEAYLHGDLARASNTRLDAAADLVALHYSIKDGSGLERLSGTSAAGLEQMTEILFSGKAGAYASGQLGAIQRYHTVLGMIYYATGRLTSTRADNATFQLEHAIELAGMIADQDATKYRPLPELQTLLADVYHRLGRDDDSASLWLDATMGYLETDDLTGASRSLDQAQSQYADRARTSALATILAGRVAIDAKGVDVVTSPPGAETAVLVPELAWVAATDTKSLPQRFVDGQKFKVLADLGALLEKSGYTKAAQYVGARALNAYVGQQTLLSPTDLRRLQNVGRNISGTQASPDEVSRNISRGSEAQSVYDKEWSVPSGASETVITMNPEVLEKGKEILQQEAEQKPIRFQRIRQ